MEFLLSVDFDGVTELREQAQHVSAVNHVEGVPTIGLEVDRFRTRPSPALHIDVGTESQPPWDTPAFLHVTLFVRDGWLNTLNVTWYDQMPTELPTPDELRTPRILKPDSFEEEPKREQ